MGFINKDELLDISSHLDKSGYGLYLKNLLKES